MSEETFYKSVRESVYNYAPEVPASVYGAMRRKLWWSRFLAFDAYRMNAWYLILIIAASGIGVSRINSFREARGAALRECSLETALRPSCQPAEQTDGLAIEPAMNNHDLKGTKPEPQVMTSGSVSSTPSSDIVQDIDTPAGVSSPDSEFPESMDNSKTSDKPSEENVPSLKPSQRKGRSLQPTRYQDKN